MASNRRNKAGKFIVCFRVGGKQYNRELGTDDEREASARLKRIEATIHDIGTGRLTVPADCQDVGTFVVSDGKLTAKVSERPAGPMGQYAGWYASWGWDSVCWASQILHAGNGRWTPSPMSGQVSVGVFRPGQLDDVCDVNHFWSLHSGGANFAFADGSVHFLSYSSANLIPALATRASSEVVFVE